MPDKSNIGLLVERMVFAVVDDLDEVQIDEVIQPEFSTISIRVSAGAVGKVIGKQGRTARSLRTILSAAGIKVKASLNPRHR